MPTVLTVGPYRFVFFSSDRQEPVPIHVKRDRLVAKFWLDPIALATNRGFPNHELGQVERLIVENQHLMIEAWHEYFDA